MELEPGMTAPTEVVLFEPDLLFSSKIEGAAKRLNIELRVFTDLNELLRELEGSVPRAFVISLDALEGKLSALKNLLRGRSRVIGYYSHVKAHLAEEAKGVGMEIVLSRGAFVARMEEVLTGVLGK